MSRCNMMQEFQPATDERFLDQLDGLLHTYVNPREPTVTVMDWPPQFAGALLWLDPGPSPHMSVPPAGRLCSLSQWPMCPIAAVIDQMYEEDVGSFLIARREEPGGPRLTDLERVLLRALVVLCEPTIRVSDFLIMSDATYSASQSGLLESIRGIWGDTPPWRGN